MVTPKKLQFSTSDGSCDETLSRRKSSRIRAASDTAEAEETKMNKKTKKTDLVSPVNNRIWSDEDEVFVLKKLVDFRVKNGNGSKVDWDAFYGFIGTSIAGKYSKKQVLSKIKKLKSKFLDHYEKIQRENDPHFSKCTDSEAFGYSMMLWGLNEGESHPERLKEHEEPFNDSGVAKLTENESVLKAQQSNKDKELLKEHNEAANIMENESTGKESQDDYDVLANVRDAFETLLSSGLSDHQKKLKLEKLMSLGSEIKRQLSDEWKALCVEESELKIQKFLFSATLAEAVTDL